MKTNQRIASIAEAVSLDFDVTGFKAFHLSELILDDDLDFELPTNLRLGHLAEKIVSGLIKSSSNYNMLFENIQLLEAKKTIGEIDFIIEEEQTKHVIHLELAYKFYLYDPSLSSDPINNWIGPNRNDSLKEKLDKLKTKQFPLLYHDSATLKLSEIDIGKTSQELCFLVSLFVPYDYNGSFGSTYEKAIKGYYIDMVAFMGFDHSDKSYYLPSKKEWGMDPSKTKIWTAINGIETSIRASIEEKQALLCWEKVGDSYSTFFIVWW